MFVLCWLHLASDLFPELTGSLLWARPLLFPVSYLGLKPDGECWRLIWLKYLINFSLQRRGIIAARCRGQVSRWPAGFIHSVPSSKSNDNLEGRCFSSCPNTALPYPPPSSRVPVHPWWWPPYTLPQQALPPSILCPSGWAPGWVGPPSWSTQPQCW